MRPLTLLRKAGWWKIVIETRPDINGEDPVMFISGPWIAEHTQGSDLSILADVYILQKIIVSINIINSSLIL